MKLISTIGEQRTIGFAINGMSRDILRGLLFGGPNSVDAFFRACSWNQCWFVGDVVSVQIDMPSTCERPIIAARARAAAMAQVDLEQYTRHVYAGNFPCPASMGSLGYMTTPGGTQYSSLWSINGGALPHEMCHCMNMAHAGVAGGSDRGDPTDQLGAGSANAELNAPHRVAAKWAIPWSIDSGGEFKIAPLEMVNSVNTRIIRIPRPNSGDYLYLSYRQSPALYEPLRKGVHLHTWRPNTGFDDIVETRLIDTHPGSIYQALDAPLLDGETWTDAANGISIQQLNHGPEYVTVRITFGQQPPPPPPPPPPAQTVTVEPETATLHAGQLLQFTASEDVRWSVDHGSINYAGLYTAPSRIKKPTTATVTATSLATGAVGRAIVQLLKW